MSPLSISSLILIVAGAIVMAVCVRRFGPVVRKLRAVSETEYCKVRYLVMVLTGLMSFFLLGYLAVALAIAMKIKFIGELFVGIIFFFGAVFVLLGIILQSKMTASLKYRYEEAIRSNHALSTEQINLSKLNERLTDEIIERREVEKALTASKRFLQDILDSLPEQIMVINRDSTIALANRQTLKINGMDRLPEGIHCHRISHDSDVPCTGDAHPCPLEAILRTGKPVTMEHIHTDSKGSQAVIEIIAVPIVDETGAIHQIVESCRDITSRRQAEERLRESELKYRKLSEVTVEGICFNDNSLIIDVNESFALMFGYRREELIGIDAAEKLIVPECRDRVAHIVNTQSHQVYEAIGVRKDGTRFPVEIEGRGIQYQGRPIRVASVRDITERKQTEQRISMMQKMQAIGTLAGGIAHDFNNILSAIMGYTEMCLLDADPRGKMANRLNNILQASHRATDLVGQILSFSRSEEGEIRPVKVAMIIKETLKLLRPSIPATIEIITDIQRDGGYIGADATRIHQILMNLCANAAHAMRSEGGTLTIGLHSVFIGQGFQHSMTDVCPGAYVHLWVADTGQGMDAQTLGRIFEPYFTTKEKGQGTGLGLFVVHGIVQQFRGWMDVTSKPGQGTTVSIFFPKSETESIADSMETNVYPTGSETILVVDDDIPLVNMTSEMLAGLGYRVIPATGASEALRLFRDASNDVDLVITDQTMPGMTGEKLILRLRAIRPDIPTIICTGFSQSIDPQKSREQGIDGFFMKPMKMVDVARTIRQILDQPKRSVDRPGAVSSSIN